jgi:hypothetical protein
MRGFAIAATAWLLLAPAMAAQPPGMRNPQVRPANASAGLPAVDDNLIANGYPIAGGICAEWGHQVPCNNHYSTTRASTKYVMASDGMFASVPSNVFALGSNTGALIEEARTNLALWSRDLTQSGTWVAVTMTTAKNAVGIDGVANSATTLTSSSAAGTILQSLTQASAAYTYTVYVKGITVTGAIQVADYPVLTPAFTTLSSSNCFNPAGTGVAPASGQTGFLRCTVTATSLNPVIGFKFANSGDSIVADFSQLEAGSFGTSPCLTTSITCTRSADSATFIGAAKAAMQGAAGAFIAATGSFVNASGFPEIWAFSASTKLEMQGSLTIMSLQDAGTALTKNPSTSYAIPQKTGHSWDSTGRTLAIGGGAVITDAAATAARTTIYLGSINGAQNADTSFGRVSLFTSRPSNTALQAMTQ